jgi:hypothetical protein
MVEIIGFVTMVGLVWLLDFALVTESEAEERRIAGNPFGSFGRDGNGVQKGAKGKRVAA